MADKKIESFLDTVYSAAEEKAQNMIREIDRAGDASLREYKAELRRFADAERRRENAKAERLGAENAAQDESEIRQAILSRREAITDEVFAEIRLRIERYRTTAEYKDSLVRDALSVADILSDKDGAAILIGGADSDMTSTLESVAGLPVRVDDSIKMGGLRGISADMELDCTLDTKFLLAREDFTKESGLSVV